MPETDGMGMTLAARLSEFQSIIGSTRVTDISGNRLDMEVAIQRILDALQDLRRGGGSLFLVGNGGSAAVASHCATDFVNVGKLRATTLHDSSLLTCMANDHGYENAFARILSTLARPGDALIAISSSGNSPNIHNAVATMRDLGGTVVTLSGFAADNRLRASGNLNIWLDSRDYGMVETGHQFLLHNVVDRVRLNRT